jgi:hypothetical protein
MQSPERHLIHEATSLYRLIESIDQFVAEHENLFAYTDATEMFFKSVHQRATNARAKVSGIVEKHLQLPTQSDDHDRVEVIIQKAHWRILHTYIKPATDAHTLNLPVPLIRLAGEHLQQISGMQAASIIVLLTPALMYYQNAPQSHLPRNLVFVEVPYSQGPSFFTNLTIYHELGHYVYDRLVDANPESQAIKNLAGALEQAFEGVIGAPELRPSNRAWTKSVLVAWTQEIFCDLYALRHLGPAFSWALIDMLSLIDLMQEDTETIFNEDHPAPALRFREQFTRLEKDGWWSSVEKLASDHVALIKRLSTRNQTDYTFEFKGTPLPRFTQAFLAVLPFIHALIEEITPHCNSSAQDFTQHRHSIEDCLLNGIVPSQLFSETGPLSPAPVSIINASYCFYLTQLPSLMAKLAGQNASNLKQRRYWIERLEAWTVKALEDHQVLESLKRSRSAKDD